MSFYIVLENIYYLVTKHEKPLLLILYEFLRKVRPFSNKQSHIYVNLSVPGGVAVTLRYFAIGENTESLILVLTP